MSLIWNYIWIPSILLLILVYSSETNVIARYTYGEDDAGTAQTVNSGDVVTLDGSNSNDPDGDQLNYYWTQTSGKNVTLSDIHIANPTFTAPNVNTLTNLKFTLIVDDGNFSSSPSYVDIEVNPSQQSNVPSPSNSQTAQSPQPITSDYSGIVIFIIILVTIAAIIIKLRHRGGKYQERRYFPEYVKKETLRDQNYRCAICKRSAGVWDFDHVDGNRSNNDPDNCQALCPNCHAKKSRGLLRQEKKSSSLHRLKVGIIIFFVVLLIIIILSFLIGTYSNVNQPITSSP